MQRALVMTIIGRDRPGLVDSVASLVAQHDGNWLESRMSRLGGHFAGILRAEVSAARESALLAALKQLEAGGLQVIVHADPVTVPAAKLSLSVLEIIGQDRPGIIRDIYPCAGRSRGERGGVADGMCERGDVWRDAVQGSGHVEYSRVVPASPTAQATGKGGGGFIGGRVFGKSGARVTLF
jgi:predicted amino acid-binding ACT domain protein